MTCNPQACAQLRAAWLSPAQPSEWEPVAPHRFMEVAVHLLKHHGVLAIDFRQPNQGLRGTRYLHRYTGRDIAVVGHYATGVSLAWVRYDFIKAHGCAAAGLPVTESEGATHD